MDLATKLEQQGSSRKITADMFGTSLRAYQRKMDALQGCDDVQPSVHPDASEAGGFEHVYFGW